MNVLSEHLVSSLKNQYTLLMKQCDERNESQNPKSTKGGAAPVPGLKEHNLFRMIRLHMKLIANTMANKTNQTNQLISMRSKSYSSDFALDEIHFSGSGTIKMRSPSSSSSSSPAPRYSNSPSKTCSDSIGPVRCHTGNNGSYETKNSPYDTNDSDDDNESKLNYSESSSEEDSSEEDYDYDYSCSDSEDSFYGLTQQETYEKLIRKWASETIVNEIPDIDCSANSEPATAANDSALDIMDSVVFLQNNNGRFKTVIIKQAKQAKQVKPQNKEDNSNISTIESQIESKKENDNNTLSLDDVERRFYHKIKHHPRNIKQLLSFCQQNNYQFGYKAIKTWWVNRYN